jgi:uncharacterized protein YigE (DUF2233 family)
VPLCLCLLFLAGISDIRAEQDIAFPTLSENGFLPAESAEEEFIHADWKAGRWCYISRDLRVDIVRFSGKVFNKKAVWFVADIRARDGMSFAAFPESAEKPGAKSRPEYIAQKNRVVYAQNGDLWTWRTEEKRYPGLIIREGKVIKSQTYKACCEAMPPLDELSVYEDGRFEVRYPGEMSAEEYLARGARDVFAFGPILIRDGVIDGRLDREYLSLQPRSAIGMVEPGHYVGILAEGRTKRSSHGTGLKFLAEILLERGCTQAFNLDGGQTAAMIFMGELVMNEPTYNGYTNTRSQPDVIGIGTSEQVKEFNPKK